MIDVGVGLLPDERIRGLIIDLGEALNEEYPTTYRLGDIFHPHLSLYQGTFVELHDVYAGLRVFDPRSALNAELILRYIIFHPSGYVTFRCDRTESLQKLHEDVTGLAARERLVAVDSIWKRNNIPLNAREQESVSRWGYHNAFDLFDPHYTLGRTIDYVGESERNIVVRELSHQAAGYVGRIFRPSNIVVYELGIDGRCMNPSSLLS